MLYSTEVFKLAYKHYLYSAGMNLFRYEVNSLGAEV